MEHGLLIIYYGIFPLVCGKGKILMITMNDYPVNPL